jgi:hypothetical protein
VIDFGRKKQQDCSSRRGRRRHLGDQQKYMLRLKGGKALPPNAPKGLNFDGVIWKG